MVNKSHETHIIILLRQVFGQASNNCNLDLLTKRTKHHHAPRVQFGKPVALKFGNILSLPTRMGIPFVNIVNGYIRKVHRL